MRDLGVECGGSGDTTIRLRPSLIFTPKHAEQFLHILESACSELEGKYDGLSPMWQDWQEKENIMVDNREAAAVGHT